MKRFILALALTTTPAWAENVTIFVVGEEGVTERPGNLTLEEAAIVLGESEPPEGATGVILEEGKSPRWTSLPASEVDKEYGGDGNPTRELFPTDERETPAEELFPDDDDTDRVAPIELFPEDDNAGRNVAIAPSAGVWIGELRDQTITNCPGGIATALATQFAGLDGAEIQGTIDASFDPVAIMPQLTWDKTGSSAWIGDMDMTQPGGFGIRVQWAMTVKSPDLIKNRQQININGPLAGSCKVVTDIDYVRVD